MNLVTVEQRLHGDAAGLRHLHHCARSASLPLLQGAGSALQLTFREMNRIDHLGHHAEADAMEAACLTLAGVLVNHMDECGFTAAIGKTAHHMHDFAFAGNVSAMMFDHMMLVEKLAIPSAKIVPFWAMVDRRRDATIRMFAQDGFRLAPLLARRRKTAAEVPDWAHLLRPWVLLSGVLLGAGNVAAEVLTAGIGTGLAIACGVTAGAAIIDGVADDP